jgi:hypothetical protein
MTPPIHHIGGHVMLGEQPLTLADATALWQDTGADFMSAAKARDLANQGGRIGKIVRVSAEMTRLSLLESALRRAITECADWRKAAGWDDPFAADERRVCTQNGDD